MSDISLTLRPQKEEDLDAIRLLERRAFGPGRFARTAYRVREQSEDRGAICIVASEGSKLVGSIRFSPIKIGGETGAMLLGPLVVDPDCLGRGLGSQLMTAGLEAARSAGVELVLLVGDLPFYGRFGFSQVPFGQMSFPGPVDPSRLLMVDLQGDGRKVFSGLVLGVG